MHIIPNSESNVYCVCVFVCLHVCMKLEINFSGAIYVHFGVRMNVLSGVVWLASEPLAGKGTASV